MFPISNQFTDLIKSPLGQKKKKDVAPEISVFLDAISSHTDPPPQKKNMGSGMEQRGELDNPIRGYRLVEVRRFFVKTSSDGGTAAAPRMSVEGEGSGKAARKNPGKEGRRGRKGGGREIVTPRRRVQRQGNERLPALHHAQGLPQSAGGRGKMPHVSALLAPLLVCVHLGLCVQDGKEAGNPESRNLFRILH